MINNFSKISQFKDLMDATVVVLVVYIDYFILSISIFFQWPKTIYFMYILFILSNPNIVLNLITTNVSDKNGFY